MYIAKALLELTTITDLEINSLYEAKQSLNKKPYSKAMQNCSNLDKWISQPMEGSGHN